ncbi:unnamed protein product [Owenia fusiformis]|uniref:Uncharacterized protein n=1 Tax=Owenia fusiformis TaxID=6347 RepID=A0A8J1URV3_OWEFU|nr:unnamed protein product [Owenia fusiformis]
MSAPMKMSKFFRKSSNLAKMCLTHCNEQTLLSRKNSTLSLGCTQRDGLKPKGCQMQLQRTCYKARMVDMEKSQVFYFDTHTLVTSLTDAGFTVDQAEGLTAALVGIMNNSVENQNKTLVTKANQEIVIQQVMSHIAAVKKDMVILEKSEFTNLKNENEKQKTEIEHLKRTVTDQLDKLKGGITLDINLERSRAKEDHAWTEKELSILNNKISTETANLRTIYEQYRNDVFKYAGGTIISCLTISLGFYRLWS